MNFNLIILLILATYFIVLMLISAFSGSKGDNETFFTGNKKAPWYIVSIGMIGNSISGVSFVSVPGMVKDNGFLYMQTVIGFFFGYLIIAKILLPLYYKLESPSIYTYLQNRFGNSAYKTGSWFFLISKGIGSAARIYVVAIILQTLVFSGFGITFPVTATILIFMIWLYTYKSGIKTIVWTDMLQSVIMIAAMIFMLFSISNQMNLSISELADTISRSEMFKVFEFEDYKSKQFFIKQFFSGIFIALVMTGLDQDMIQKNRTINKLEDAQKNMYYYGFGFIPVNFIFLVLGTLIYIYAANEAIVLPATSDQVLPMLASKGYLGTFASILFVIGIVSATFSGADSSMTSMTTSYCVDIANKKDDVKFRKVIHLLIAIIFVIMIIVFDIVNKKSLIDAIYTIVSYTYGPLLGLFAFGITTKRKTIDKYIPAIAFLSPVICYILQLISKTQFNYNFGYELLMLNGLMTYTGLWIFSLKK